MDREKIVERDFMGLSNGDEIAEKKEMDAGTKDSNTDVPVEDGSHNSSNNVPCQRFGAPPKAYSAGSTEGLSSSAHPGAEYGVFPISNLSFPMQSFGQHIGAPSISKGQQAVSGACGGPSMANPSPIQHSFFPDFAGNYPSTRATSKSGNIPGNPPSAQLTIFYAGTVNVYDDIPADKAQGLMLLAASARPTKMTNQPPRSPLMSMAMATGGHTPSISSPFPPSLPNRVSPVTPQAPLQKPQSSSQPNPSAAVSLSTGDSQANQNVVTSISQQEASMSSATVITPAPVAPRAVPQARKASLARFLEKRKERIGTKAPYPTKKSPDASPQREQSPSSKHSSPLDGCLTKKHQLTCAGLEEKIPFDSENIESYLDEDRKEHMCLQKVPKIEREECEITV
ncbi:hypothetical protein SUGI_0324280 [Cryptomeria japonica]|uniref:protein TIFY 6a isoform X1 n=1 Tax=Cryptomeria japonica TaxID=3369 RepID=UPI002408E781|nr:protein TIFY 6a isoform X1 [Cryptomeria japonica]GLJ18323.1 hypothetical protein SUGI_0324280 [Cryptomeria japonica]